MYLFERQGADYTLVAWDDDSGFGLASKLGGYDYCTYAVKDIRILVFAYEPTLGGTCDLAVDGSVIRNDYHFGGSINRNATWEGASPYNNFNPDRFETTGEWGLEASGHVPAFDTVLYAFGGIGSKLIENDDGGLGYQAKLSVAYSCASGWSSHRTRPPISTGTPTCGSISRKAPTWTATWMVSRRR